MKTENRRGDAEAEAEAIASSDETEGVNAEEQRISKGDRGIQCR